MRVMPFGKYKGWELNDVPRDYLEWLVRQRWLRDPLKTNVAWELERRAINGGDDPPGSRSTAEIIARMSRDELLGGCKFST